MLKNIEQDIIMIIAAHRGHAIDVYQDFIHQVEITEGERLVIGVCGPEGCGKSLASDSFLHFLDDDRDAKNIPNEGKSVIEEEEGAALARAHSVIVNRNGMPIRFTIAREVDDVEKLPEFDGPDYVVFLHSWEEPPETLKQDITIGVDTDYVQRQPVTTIDVSAKNPKYTAVVSRFSEGMQRASVDVCVAVVKPKSLPALKR